jgi:His-Xaa-Ser system protein HxsD
MIDPGAAYRLSDRLSIELKADGPNVICLVRLSEHGLDEVLDEFRVAVIDEVLRMRIRLETQGERNLILALAFSAITENQT